MNQVLQREDSKVRPDGSTLGMSGVAVGIWHGHVLTMWLIVSGHRWCGPRFSNSRGTGGGSSLALKPGVCALQGRWLVREGAETSIELSE